MRLLPPRIAGLTNLPERAQGEAADERGWSEQGAQLSRGRSKRYFIIGGAT